MTRVAAGRAWPSLEAAIFAAIVPLYALATPLGLARVEAAGQVASGLALDTTTEPATFGLLAMRLAQLVPLGDQPFRANLASALLCAFAVALLGRLYLESVALLRPSANARQDRRDLLREPIAAFGVAMAAALSFSVFEIGTSAGSAAATLVILAGGLLAGFALLRDSSAASAGVALAGLAGLSAGVDAVAGPLLWPPLVGLGIWALRKGERWPLMAPLCFVAAWGGSLLASVAAASAPAAASGLFSSLGTLGRHAGAGLWTTVVELGDQIGVVGTLLAVVGLMVLASRAAVLSAWLLLTVFSALLFAHPAARAQAVVGAVRVALPLAIVVSCVFAGVGLLHVSAKLGRAHLAAAFTLAILLVLSPALDGGRGRWLRRSALPMHLLDRALARAEVRAVVHPGTAEMDGLFRLARALGLRPDLELGEEVGKARATQGQPHTY
jgi:hypothetical protein